MNVRILIFCTLLSTVQQYQCALIKNIWHKHPAKIVTIVGTAVAFFGFGLWDQKRACRERKKYLLIDAYKDDLKLKELVHEEKRVYQLVGKDETILSECEEESIPYLKVTEHHMMDRPSRYFLKFKEKNNQSGPTELNDKLANKILAQFLCNKYNLSPETGEPIKFGGVTFYIYRNEEKYQTLFPDQNTENKIIVLPNELLKNHPSELVADLEEYYKKYLNKDDYSKELIQKNIKYLKDILEAIKKNNKDEENKINNLNTESLKELKDYFDEKLPSQKDMKCAMGRFDAEDPFFNDDLELLVNQLLGRPSRRQTLFEFFGIVSRK